MVITDKFVYIHQPKTGGTFVTSSLLKLYGVRWNKLHHLRFAIFGKIGFRGKPGTLILHAQKHDPCHRIPEVYRDRAILSSMRNPYDYYVSQYEFGWWKRREYLKFYRRVPGFRERFSSFPELSFPDYLRLMAAAYNPHAHQNFDDPAAVGRFTATFIHYFFREPDVVLYRLDEGYLNSDACRNDMFPVHFLFTSSINKQLHGFLLEQGYSPEDIAFILRKRKVLPMGRGRSEKQNWQSYFTPELKALIRRKDHLLFRLFPQFEDL